MRSHPLELNLIFARLIQIPGVYPPRHASRANYAVGFCYDAKSGKVNRASSRVGGSKTLARRAASERRMDLHDGADVGHGVSSARPAIGQSVLRRS